MKTNVWMAHSCSTHFSDQVSYITLYISINGLKDMILARFKHFLQKQKEGTKLVGPALGRILYAGAGRELGQNLACKRRRIGAGRTGRQAGSEDLGQGPSGAGSEQPDLSSEEHKKVGIKSACPEI
jgi:hypothetical protein